MKGVCPCCSASASIEAFLNDAEGRQAVATAAALPGDLGPVALRYIALHRPKKYQLSWTRVRKLLAEIAAMVAAGGVDYEGRFYPASNSMFASAMSQMLDSPTVVRPISGHGYLLKIVKTESLNAESANEAAKRRASQARGAIEGERRVSVAQRVTEPSEADRAALSPLERHFFDFLKERRDAGKPPPSAAELAAARTEFLSRNTNA